MSGVQALALAGVLLLGQSTEPAVAADEDAVRIEKLFELARSGRATVRPQAAEKLVEYGPAAAERIKIAAGETNAELALLGKNLVGVLGLCGDAELRARTWSALEDVDFPWRPSAARTLARSALASEAGAFVELLDDPLAAVREAAIVACGTLDPGSPRGEWRELVRAALGDPNDRVRRAAAAQLAIWGEPEALALHLAELERTDSFFDLDTGRMARIEALATLRERLGTDHAYRPDLPQDAEPNPLAYQQLAADLVTLRGKRPALELPAIAAPYDPVNAVTGPTLLGLELRSCRRGEYFLRWSANDRLLVGTGNAAVLELPAGTVERLLEVANARLPELGDERFWGTPGCDSEVFHSRTPGAERTTVLELSKGPQTAADLRPAPLDALALALLATLPDKHDHDPRLNLLATRVRAALEALGGDLEAPQSVR